MYQFPCVEQQLPTQADGLNIRTVQFEQQDVSSVQMRTLLGLEQKGRSILVNVDVRNKKKEEPLEGLEKKEKKMKYFVTNTWTI